MVRRVDLSQIIGEAAADATAGDEPVASQEKAPSRFETLRPKEVRMTDSQYMRLFELASALNRKRGVKDERITSNTLIRVAIEVILTMAGSLEGDNEKELMISAFRYLER